MSVNPAAFRRLMREIKQLQTEPPEGIRITTDEENILDVTGIIQGPDGTPYEGGYFKVKFKFTEEFPAAPPKCWFITKIFHPNVSKQGEICVNTLKKDWKKEYGIAHILVTVKCLLIYPNPESALDEAAGKLLLEKYEDYCKHAKVMTSVHATPKIRPPEFDIPSVIPDSKPTTAPAPAPPTVSAPTPSATTSSSSSRRQNTPAPPITSPQSRSTSSSTPLVSLNSTIPMVTATTMKPLSKSSVVTSPAPIVAHLPLQPSSSSNHPSTETLVHSKPTSGEGLAPMKVSASTGKGELKRANANATTGGNAEKRKKGLKRL